VSQNKYFKEYWKLINNARLKFNPFCVGCEIHHIYPVSIYGDGETVQFTFDEHLLAHKLLWLGLKIKYGNKFVDTCLMQYAYFKMKIKKKEITNEFTKRSTFKK